MNMLQKIFAMIIACGMLTGCLEVNDVYTINPDGSGKVVHEAVITSMNISMGEASSDGPSEAKLKKSIKDELSKAKGVDTWADVTYEQKSEDKIYFKGTAYFKDINQLKFHNSGTSINIYDKISVKKEADQMILEIQSTDKDEGSSANAEKQDIDESNVGEQIQKLKNEYQKTRMMAAGLFSGIKLKRGFQLPGTIVSQSNFQSSDDGMIRNVFEGAKLLEFMDAMMSDDAWLKSELLKGNNPLKGGGPKDENMVNEVVFGEKAPVRVTIQPGTSPLFDYDGEVEAAKAKYSAIAKDLGAPVKVMLADGKASRFQVAGVQLISKVDGDNNIRPFNFDKGYTVSVLGRLPQQVLNVTGGRLLSANTDHGQNLLPENDWDQKINFPRVSADKNKVNFEIKLKIPSKSAKGLQEITGVLEYLVAEKTRRVDLNMNEFKAGTKGSEFDAKIKSVKDNQWHPGKQELELEIKINRNSVKSIQLRDQNGNLLEVQEGYMAYSDRTTYTYTLKNGGAFPAAGSIVLEVYEDIKTYELPFEIKDVSLLGYPNT